MLAAAKRHHEQDIQFMVIKIRQRTVLRISARVQGFVVHGWLVRHDLALGIVAVPAGAFRTLKASSVAGRRIYGGMTIKAGDWSSSSKDGGHGRRQTRVDHMGLLGAT